MANPLSSTPRLQLLDLPTEILYEIVECSRPLDFESLLLSSKRLYHIGERLIPAHEYCKSWVSKIVVSPRVSSMEILDGVQSADSNHQQWLFQYITHLSYDGLDMSMSNANQFLEQVEKVEYIMEQVDRIVQVIPEFQNLRRASTASGDKYTSWEPELKWANFVRVDAPKVNMYELAFLILFSNLKLLSLGELPTSWPGFSLDLAMKQYHKNGATLFRELEALHLKQATCTSWQAIFTWMKLPRLRCLFVSRPVAPPDRQGFVDHLSTDWPYGVDESLLDHLVLLEATVNVEVVVIMLERIRALQSFMWEEAMDCFDEDPNAEDEPLDTNFVLHSPIPGNPWEGQGQPFKNVDKIKADITMGQPLRGANGLVTLEMFSGEMSQVTLYYYYSARISTLYKNVEMENIRQYWKPLETTNFDNDEADDEEEEEIFDPSFTYSFNQRPHEKAAVIRLNKTKLFNPQRIVERLSQKFAGSLKHLTLTVTSHRRDVILRHHKVWDFLALSSLTHLEVDELYLKPIKGSMEDYPVGHVPRSLTRVVPSSIKFLCVNIRKGVFQNIHRMLRKFPTERARAPRLDQLVIRFIESNAPYETLTRIQPLEQEIKKVGITLNLQESGVDGPFRNRKPIGMDGTFPFSLTFPN
jgi:hypothetical protein